MKVSQKKPLKQSTKRFLLELDSAIAFYRTELRVWQATAETNEQFLQAVATWMARENMDREQLSRELQLAEDRIRKLELER